jgi:2'-5' RNA ligase
MARLFFALWPDEAAVGALAEWARRLAGDAEGRAVPAEKIHMTLAFLGETSDERRAEALRTAAGLRPRAFALALDEVGSFRRAGVAWVGASRPPAELVALQSRLESALRGRGFALDDRAFAPHVTLARRTQRAIARRAIAPIVWRAEAFTLVRSEAGTGRYVVEERWDLRD